jgi:hypothetical protein
MSSYQLLNVPCAPDVRRKIMLAAAKLEFLGLALIKIQIGRGITMIVQPTYATRRLQSVYTGQGWENGMFYKSYAAVIDDIKVVWHKPMRHPEATNVVRWPGHGNRRVAQ